MNLTGSLVRLGPLDLETAPAIFARWRDDTEFTRLLGDTVVPERAPTVRKRWEQYTPGDSYRFLIYTLADDRLIGFINLWPNNADRDCWIGIGIGEATERGKGYGTDAMRIALRYIFDELEIERASLGVFADNIRAVRAYQRAGFIIEGRQREDTLREGWRWDALYMGILSSEFRDQSAVR